jgi:hypothetical protein
MPRFARVIAESNHGTWSAWFSDSPHLVCDGGDDWALAVARLIDIHGTSDLDWSLISPVEDSTTSDHAEFLIPVSATCRLSLSIAVNQGA